MTTELEVPPYPTPTGNAGADSQALAAWEANLAKQFDANPNMVAPTAGKLGGSDTREELVQADEHRAAEALKAAGGVDHKYVAKLQEIQRAVGANPSSDLNSAMFIELRLALAGRRHGEVLDDFLQRSGVQMSAQERADYRRAVVAAKDEIQSKTIDPKERAVGLVHHSEIKDTSGYSLAGVGGRGLNPEATAHMLKIARESGASQELIDWYIANHQ